MTNSINNDRTFRLALLESDIAWADKQTNLNNIKQNIAYVPDGTDMIALPEMFTTGCITASKDDAMPQAERNTGDTMTEMKRMSGVYNVAFTGSFLAHTAGMLFNRGFFMEPSGDETFYDKRHLFSIGGENNVFKQGNQIAPVIRYRGVSIKLIICYDLRFPVFCRNVRNEYDVLLVVANWPVARLKDWKRLLAARAIENQCYVCGVNRAGVDAYGVDYGKGTSTILDYKGDEIGTKIGEQCVAADISMQALHNYRDKFPVWRDADRFDLK